MTHGQVKLTINKKKKKKTKKESTQFSGLGRALQVEKGVHRGGEGLFSPISPSHCSFFFCSKPQPHLYHIMGVLLPNLVQDHVRKQKIQFWHQRVESVHPRSGQERVLGHHPSLLPSLHLGPSPHLKHGPLATNQCNHRPYGHCKNFTVRTRRLRTQSFHDVSKWVTQGLLKEYAGWGVSGRNKMRRHISPYPW